jgi:hypothetical protein
LPYSLWESLTLQFIVITGRVFSWYMGNGMPVAISLLLVMVGTYIISSHNHKSSYMENL